MTPSQGPTGSVFMVHQALIDDRLILIAAPSSPAAGDPLYAASV